MLSSRRGSFRSGGLRELAGSPKGLPPYCVGFIPHLEDGSLPGGFVHTVPHSFVHAVPRSEMVSATDSVQPEDELDDELAPALRGEYENLAYVTPDDTAVLQFDTPLSVSLQL